MLCNNLRYAISLLIAKEFRPRFYTILLGTAFIIPVGFSPPCCFPLHLFKLLLKFLVSNRVPNWGCIFSNWANKWLIALKFSFSITSYQIFCKKCLQWLALEVMLETWYFQRSFLSIWTPKYLAWWIFSRHFLDTVFKH